MKAQFLISGVGSGLGKYLYEKLGGIGLSRNNAQEELIKIKDTGVASIIHCAFNSERHVDTKSLSSYVEDNVFLTRQLTKIPNKYFIFMSTVDIYPKNRKLHVENEDVSGDKVQGLYPITKLISESIVNKNCDNFLTLRSTSLLGRYSRKNSLIRIMEGANSVSLSDKSEFNFVLYKDILALIIIAIKNNLNGIYNVASSKNIKITDIAKFFGKKVKYGNYKYNVGHIDNSKIVKISPTFMKTSEDVIKEFVKAG